MRAMAKANKIISSSKKIINKTKEKPNVVDSIPSKRLTRSNTSKIILTSKKVIQQKKSEAEIVPRVTRSSQKLKFSSELDTESKQGKDSQHRLSQRSDTEIEKLSKSKFEGEKDQSFDLPHATRSQKKNPLNDVSISIAPSTVKTENRIVKRHDFIKLREIAINTICLAKQKYSQPWPALILKIENEKTLVHFFGDYRVGYVQSTEVYDFIKSIAAIKSSLTKKRNPRGYVSGLKEVEYLLKIDSSLSVFNKN